MSYVVERDWITKAGLRAVCTMNETMGHRCGYVAIPPSHPLYGKSYAEECDCLTEGSKDVANGPIGKRGHLPVFCASVTGKLNSPDIFFDVHGSLTYSGGSGEYPIVASDLWWFGFDCGHHGDASKHSPGVARTQEYVVDECESLATQLVEVKPIAAKE